MPVFASAAHATTRDESDRLVPARRSRFSAAHHQALHDLKTRWRRGLFWTFYFFVFVALTFSLAQLLALSRNISLVGATACRPDGAFSLQPNDYDYWDASGFFQVTLGFEAMTFSEAKALDVVWDVVSI
jgi:hypothetical protein